MKRLSWLIAAPVALVVIAFAVANRHSVTLSFDPFAEGTPAIALVLPLWIVAFVPFVAGIVVGGLSVWAVRARIALRRSARQRKEAKSGKGEDALEGVPAISRAASPDPTAPMLQPPRSGLSQPRPKRSSAG
jgi:uncharacterized integral membrane protein